VAEPFSPVARSAIRPPGPTQLLGGWEVSTRVSASSLWLGDVSALSKVLVMSDRDGPVAAYLGVAHLRATRRADGVLVVGSGPGEWLLVGTPGSAPSLVEEVEAQRGESFTSVVDLTHGRALLRLTGPAAPLVLAKLCAVDFSDRVTPNLVALRSQVANLVTDVVRDDLDGARSYLLHCERSSGQYLHDVLIEAGVEWGMEPTGVLAPPAKEI
jgi:heterotetrameric sarcosine oxidase gamma subunit